MSEFRALSGRCHCGNIRFDFTRSTASRQIAVRLCGCSFCQKHSGAWTSDPAGSISVSVKDETALNLYAFGTETAEFYVCSRCGVVPLVVSEIDGQRYAVVSVRAFDRAAELEFVEANTDYSAEYVTGRLERRKANWIPQVEFLPANT
ncbi:MAG: hypothetical protein AAFX44_18015 [Pseudomonadota bacterium]